MYEQMEFDFITYPKYVDEQKAKEEVKPGPADKKMKQEEKAKALKDSRESKAASGKKVGELSQPCMAGQITNLSLPASKPVMQLPAPCRLGSLEIIKPERKFNLIVKNSFAPPMAMPILEIVAGYAKNPAEVTCNLQGLAGPCDKHNNKTFDFVGNTLENSNSKLKFNAYSCRALRWNLFKLVDEPVINTYPVLASTCETKRYAAMIKVYPDIKIAAGVLFPSFKFERKMSEDKTDLNHPEEIETSWGFDFHGSIKEDGKEYEVALEFKSIINKVKSALNVLKNVTSSIGKLVEGEDVSLEFELLKKKFDYEFQWKELEGRNIVDAEYKYTFDFDPILACNLKFDLIGIVLNMHPVGKVIKKFRTLSKKILEIKLEAIVFGKIAAKIESTKFAGNPELKHDIDPTLEFVRIQLKGSLETKGDSWGIYAGGELETEPMYIKPGWKSPVCKNGYEYFEVYLYFSGVHVKGAYHIMIGRKETETDLSAGAKLGKKYEAEWVPKKEWNPFNWKLRKKI